MDHDRRWVDLRNDDHDSGRLCSGRRTVEHDHCTSNVHYLESTQHIPLDLFVCDDHVAVDHDDSSVRFNNINYHVVI